MMWRRAVLIVFAIWPLVHFALVQTYDLDPWRFGGWAMYCEPRLDVSAGGGLVVDGETILVDGRLLPPEVQAALSDFLPRRRALGRLLPPDEAGRLLLALTPEVDEVVIVVRSQSFDHGRLQSEEELHRYSR